jgi:hypothetical protein
MVGANPEAAINTVTLARAPGPAPELAARRFIPATRAFSVTSVLTVAPQWLLSSSPAAPPELLWSAGKSATDNRSHLAAHPSPKR